MRHSSGRARTIAMVLLSSVFGAVASEAKETIPVPKSTQECLNHRGTMVAQVVLLPEDAQRNILGEHGELIQLLVDLCNGGQFEQAQSLVERFVNTDFSIPENQEKAAKKDCFVTTACCDAIGLADDCFELTALRRFRDRALRNMPGGMADIGLYYRLAPAILAELRRGDSARYDRLLRETYVTHILPCALYARLGFAQAARRRYHDLMVKLLGELQPAGSMLS